MDNTIPPMVVMPLLDKTPLSQMGFRWYPISRMWLYANEEEMRSRSQADMAQSILVSYSSPVDPKLPAPD